ncbi:hypothetical protein D3C78_1323950 [compost metagenome]
MRVGLQLGVPFSREFKLLKHCQLAFLRIGTDFLISRFGGVSRGQFGGIERLKFDCVNASFSSGINQRKSQFALPVMIHPSFGDDVDLVAIGCVHRVKPSRGSAYVFVDQAVQAAEQSLSLHLLVHKGCRYVCSGWQSRQQAHA